MGRSEGRNRGAASGLGGAFVALAAATGILVGLRSAVAVQPPRLRLLLRLAPLPREEMAILWSRRATWPVDLQDVALERLGGLVTALFLAAAAVATLNALILLFEAGASRRRDMAIHGALGASPRAVFRLLLGRLRTLFAAALGLGVLLGLAAGVGLRASWPGLLETVGLSSAAGHLAVPLGTLTVLAAAAYLWVGVTQASRPLAPALLDGGRVTAGRGDATRRRLLSGLQLGAAGSLVLGTLALAGAGRSAPAGDRSGTEVVAIRAALPGQSPEEGWAPILERLAALPGIRAESLATPGTLVGLGVRDFVTADCGACYRGGLPLPFWGAWADHHSVAPGYFRDTDLTLLEGRSFRWTDNADAPRVAIVNRTFARSSFQEGRPLGRLVRAGTGLDDWYTVVGVVEDMPVGAVGGDDVAREVVYLSALQHPPRVVDVLVTGTTEAVEEALHLLAAAGLEPGEPTPLVEIRRRAMLPLRWTTGIALALGGLTLLLALHGAHATSLVITRRRVRELAIRRALGATDLRVRAHVLLGAARSALGGAMVAVLLGTALVGLLRKAAGDVPQPGVGIYLGVAGLLMAASLGASRRAARAALAVEPGAAVE